MRKLAFFLVFFSLLGTAVWGQTYTWVGGTSGSEDDWSEGDNWNDGATVGTVPLSGNNIVIPVVAGNHYPTVPASVTALGTVEINGGELTAGNALTINTLTASSGELVTTGANVTVSTLTNITGAFTVTGDLNIAGTSTISAVLTHTGTLNISGALNISSGSFSGGAVNFWGGTITASASNIQIENITGTTGTLTAGTKNVGVIINTPVAAISAINITGTLTITTAGNLDMNAFALDVSGTLTNNGILNLHGANLSVGTLNNTGTGVVILTGTQTITGALGATVGGTIRYQGNASSPWPLGNNYTNLVIDTGLTMGASGGALTVSGTAQINSDVSANSISVTGQATAAGITINTAQGITLNNAANSLSGNITLNNTTSGAVSLHTANAVTISGGNAGGNFDVTANGITVNGITANGHNVTLTSTAAVTQNTGTAAAITCGTITLSGNTNFTLNNAANNVSTLQTSAANPASISFRNGAGFQTGTISTGTGVTTVTLQTPGTVTQSGSITTGTLTLIGEAATVYNLVNANNNVTTIETTADGANYPGTINYTDTNAFSIGVGGLHTSTAGSITLHAGGTITQSGIITTETLSVATTAAGAINLNTQNNNIHELQITGAGGDVAFRNTNQSLDITGISAGGHNVTIGVTGTTANLNVNGAVSNVGILTLNSDNNLTTTTTGNISSTNRAVLNALNTVTVNGNISVTNNGTETSAAIHITADTFAGSGSVLTPGSSGTVCAYLTLAAAYTGTAVGNRIHYHAVGKHIVYGVGYVDPSAYTFLSINTGAAVNAGSYVYIQADLNLSASLNLNTAAGYNIYFINVGNAANARAVEIHSAGYIEIRGGYTSTGALSLTSTGIRLNDSAIVLTPNSFTTNGSALTLLGSGITNSITASGITITNGITGAGNDLSLVAGNVSINNNSAVYAANLTITNAGPFTLGTNSNITLSGGFTQSGGGTNSIASNITITPAAGNISFTNPVTLAGAVTLNAALAGTVNFGSTVTGANNLTITGNATLRGSVGNIGALNVTGNADFLNAAFSAASVTVSGTAAVNVNINTTGNQSYAGVILGGIHHTLSSSGGSIEATGIVTGTAGVTINALHGISMINAGNTLGGAVALNNSQTGTVTGAVSFLTQNSVTITTVNNTAAGNTSIEADTITVGNPTVTGISTAANGSVTLTSGSTVTQGGAINAANLTVSAVDGITLNNNENHITASAAFTNTTSGNIVFNNNTTAAVTLGLHASNSGSGGTINIAHNNGTLNVNTTGVTSNAGAITLTGHDGITVAAAVNTGSGAAINLSSTNGSISGNGVLTGNVLTVTAANGIALNGANHINTSASLTNNTANNIGFSNTSADLGLTAVNNTRTITINQTGDLSITSVTSNNLSLDVSGAITAAGTNSVNSLHITRAGGAVEFNNNHALVLDGINASNAGVGRNNVKITTLGGITQTAGLITNTGLLDLTATGSILLPAGTGMSAHSVDELRIVSTGTGTIRFVNNRSLEIQGITAGNYDVEIINSNPVDITGTVSARDLRLETNNTAAAANNNITIGAVLTISAKLTIISGHLNGNPGSVTDRCGIITFNSNANVTGSAGNLAIEIEAGNLNNNAAITAAIGNISFLLDDLNVYGTITAANVSIKPRHGTVNLVYYTGATRPTSARFGSHIAIPSTGSDNKEFSGYNNVFLVNVTDSVNSRIINIDANGFIEFYTSNAYTNNSYTYSGTNTDHLRMNAAGRIQSYHADGGQTNVNLGSSRFFILNENISIENGSFSITAAGITFGGNAASAAANANANLILASNAGAEIHAADISGNFGFSGTSLLINGAVSADGTFNFNGTTLTVDNAMEVGGTTTIINSSLFSKAAAGGAILAHGGFAQTAAAAGTSSLAAGITTNNAPITFTREIQLAANVALQSSGGDITFAAVTRDGTAGRNFVVNAAAGRVFVSADMGTIAAGLGSISITSSVININNTINLFTGNGDITLNGNIENTTARNITFAAGTGNVNVNGSVGSVIDIGNLIITNSANAHFTGSVRAASFSQSAGSGTTTFDGTQNYTGGFSFAGANLTVNNALNTDTNTTNNDGAITITNSGLFTVGALGRIAPNGTAGTLNVTGNTQNNGIIAAGPVVSTGIAVDFHGNYTASVNGELTGSTATDPGIQFRRNVVIGTHTHNNNRLIFAESTQPHELSVASSAIPVLADVIVMDDNQVAVHANSSFKQTDGKKLTLEGNAEIDVSAGSWHMGTAGTPLNDFAGLNGDLILAKGSKLIAHNMNLTGDPVPSASFKITNTEDAIVSAKGDVDITHNVTLNGGGDINFPQLILEMDGSGIQDLTTDLMLGSLHIRLNSHTVLKTRNANSFLPEADTIYFRGEVKIFALTAPSGLDAGNLNIVMYSGLRGKRNKSASMHDGNDDIYYARWEVTDAHYIAQPPFVMLPDIDDFVFRQELGHKISFRRDISDISSDSVFFEIIGNTMWQEFECLEPGAFIQFSRYPDHHTVLDNFKITGVPGNYVTITRLTDNGYDFPYEYHTSMGAPPSVVNQNETYALPAYHPPMDLKNTNSGGNDTELKKYWNINLVSSPNPAYRPLEGFSYVRIFFSHAYNQRIPIVAREMNLDVNPYYSPSEQKGYFNFDWVELRKILYSFTEDSSGNGKLDRIRVQTNISLNGDFSKFDVEVEGHKVDSSKFNRGYQMVNEVTGTGAFDSDSFFIYLVEDPDIDSGITPVWHVRFNDSLLDALTGTQVGDPLVDINIKPYDTIPPRVAYSLTLPGHPQTYFRMSEPVVSGSVSGNSLINNEVIEITPPYTYVWQYFPFEHNQGTVTKGMTVPQANLGYILNWSSPFTVNDLVNIKNIHGDTTSMIEDKYFQIENVYDQGQRAMDWSDHKLDEAFYIFYQPPKYPLNWGYTEYAKVMGNKHLVSPEQGSGLSDDEPNAASASGSISITDVFMPPNKMLTVEMMTAIANGNGDQIKPSSFASYSGADDIVIRRITDALVSIPPVDSSSNDYFAWPVWARYQTEPNADGYFNSNDFWGTQNTDTGIIWDFDGTKYLEADSIDLQARVNTALGNFDLELFWATNIPAGLRIPKESPLRGRSTGGLWQPYPSDLHSNKLLYYYAPLSNDTSRIGQLPSSSINIPLVNFKLAENTPPGFSSGSRVEFVFRLLNNSSSSVLSDMFAARLDIPRGSVIPANWYTLVKPFSFDIQNIRHQRGGVTILNNVINSEKREVTYIRYTLVRPGRVTIQVYTLDGTLVKSIRRNEYRGTGDFTDAWDGTNNGGRPVARGMYFVRVVAPDIDEIRKIMVIK